MENTKNHSDVCCWWCCHKFDTKSLSLPLTYNDLLKTFEVYGTFCSFSCMKAYNKNDNSSSKNNRCTLITTMMNQIIYDNNISKSVSIAPPRECLKMFGGTMSIEEFRKNSEKGVVYNSMLPPYITIKTINDNRQSYANYQWVKKDEEKDTKNETESTCKTKSYVNNPIKIKSDKKAKNTLEMIFGIN